VKVSRQLPRIIFDDASEDVPGPDVRATPLRLVPLPPDDLTGPGAEAAAPEPARSPPARGAVPVLVLVPDLPSRSRRPSLHRSLDQVVAEIEIQPRSRGSRIAKRALDIFGSVVGLIVLSPLLLVIALAIKLTSRGPILFVHPRCGVGGRPFRFFKLRTMVANAEARKRDLKHLNEMSGPVFKIRRDPRITSLGRVLRKLSLDELPQLWNVLRGDMSLVGPRPPTVDEVERYTRRQVQRLSVMPGLTGLWQVSGRNNISDFDRWIDLDLEYARRWSMWLDLRILLKTVVVVALVRGAQ
jgi:exopolysaccharide biosynthesis polyprenyl glycosylphosphotransferase